MLNLLTKFNAKLIRNSIRVTFNSLSNNKCYFYKFIIKNIFS